MFRLDFEDSVDDDIRQPSWGHDSIGFVDGVISG